MTVMEQKLDRIIDALDRLSGPATDHPAGKSVGSNSANGDFYYHDRGKAEPKPLVPSDPTANDSNSFGRANASRHYAVPKRPMDSNLPALEDRVGAAERAIQDLQSKLKQLAGRVIELESHGRDTQHTHERAK